jgi:hypothetical protein
VRTSRAKPHDGFGRAFVDLKHELDLICLLDIISLIDADCIDPQNERLLSSEVMKRRTQILANGGLEDLNRFVAIICC